MCGMKNVDEKSDVVIIGGVACGPKTAATLARRNPSLKITMFQKEARMSYGSCGMPYFASGDIGSFAELMQTSYGVVRDASFFGKVKGFTALPSAEVISIDRESKTVTLRLLEEDREIVHGYDKLVIATGATPNRPPFPVAASDKIRSFTRPDDAIHFRKLAETGQVGSVAIIGGGFIGCEMAEAAAGLWGIETTLIEREPQLLPYALDPEMAALAEAEMRKQDVTVLTGTSAEEITESEEGLVVQLVDGDPIKVDYVFLCLGVTPNTGLAADAGVEIGDSKGFVVNKRMQTSDENIYAGGDCVESTHQLTDRPIYIPLGSLANRHGRVIAENIAGNNVEFPGVLGAFLVKIFDVNAGAVGLSEQAAKKAGLEYDVVWGTFPDKPDFYPESQTFAAKMVVERTTQRLLGIQVVGPGDIMRRVDVFSSYLQRQATVDDLLLFEHGYAPPYSEALDPLHHLAALAQAKSRGFDLLFPDGRLLANEVSEETVLIDVRTEEEAESEPVPAGLIEAGKKINIPLESLAASVGDLDKSAPTLVVCKRGPRSYQAAIILKNAGFEKIRFVAAGVAAMIPD